MLENSPRYLVPFDPKCVPHRFVDVLIIGGGLAGLRAALAVDPSLSVLVITKTACSSRTARLPRGASPACSIRKIASKITSPTRSRPAAICAIRPSWRWSSAKRRHESTNWSQWGTHFDQQAGGLALGREGGHSHHRIVHALGDATGKEVMRAVIERAAELTNVETWQHAFTLDLLTHEGVCRGALVWNAQHGKTLVWAKQTILCTGGAGQIYRETTNPDVATGDGLAMA